MLIVGTKYPVTKEDKQKLETTFEQIHSIDISKLNDKKAIKKILYFIETEKVKLIVLNLKRDISTTLQSLLNELNHKGIVLMSFGNFCTKYLNRKYPQNPVNFHVIEEIKDKLLYKIFKRAFDIWFASGVVITLLPLYIYIAIMIKIKSPKGPIFFTQLRLGLNGKLFRVLKFRTMVPNAECILEEWLETHQEIRNEYLKYRKLKKDPRVIEGIGEFLRKSSLDELPQFFNVLLGQMSVVGPRPYIKEEFHEHAPVYTDIITSVKPGITGLWQVNSRNKATFESRVDSDVRYISKRAMMLDLKIVLKTFGVMKRGS